MKNLLPVSLRCGPMRPKRSCAPKIAVLSFKEMDIPPFTLKYLPQGTVTLDNRLAGRYAGEVEITLTDLPADPSVNVMGRVSEGGTVPAGSHAGWGTV